MEVRLEVVLEGNVRLPVRQKVETLADVGKLGLKLKKLASDAVRLMPDLKPTPVKAITAEREKVA